MTPIVDTHQHLWDLEQFRLPWLEGGAPLASRHGPEEYQAATAGLPIAKTVYMEVDVDPAQHAAEAEYVIGLCERADDPMAGAVIGGRPASEDFAAYVERFQAHACVKGVRQVLHGGTERGTCLAEPFVRGIRLLGRLGLRFDLCMRPEELTDAARLVDLCPQTQFVLDHCGNAPVQTTDRTQWERDIADLARRENIVCKISGIVAGVRPGAWTADDLKPIVLHCAEVFGSERVMFGSDWPVCTLTAGLRDWVAALDSITADWTPRERALLFHDNAVRFYALPAP